MVHLVCIQQWARQQLAAAKAKAEQHQQQPRQGLLCEAVLLCVAAPASTRGRAAQGSQSGATAMHWTGVPICLPAAPTQTAGSPACPSRSSARRHGAAQSAGRCVPQYSRVLSGAGTTG